jgi:mannose-6-phosphate isomerase-like protein (cupin superfamily)
MKTLRPTQEEMKKRIARFKELKPRSASLQAKTGIPMEVIRMLNPKANYVLMAPDDIPGLLSVNPVVNGGHEGVLRVGIAECAPNDGPGLHVHWKTRETFIALSGKWRINWGDNAEEHVILEPFDMIAVPPKVTRQFINVSDKDAHLLVLIQGKKEDFDDVGRPSSAADPIIAKYGPEMIERLEKAGWKFRLDANAPTETTETAA